jgi:hypothetical protein
MSYHLGIMGKGITSIRILEDSEYQEYKSAVGCLTDFSSDQQLYAITLLNYDDFLNLIAVYSNAWDKNPSMINFQLLERMTLNINRHIINYLFSVRTFLDHTEFKLKRIYGDSSDKFATFKKATISEYENNFSYRFLYKLRNYSQHCGLPLGELSMKSVEEPIYSGNIKNTLVINFSSDTLLTYNGWSSEVKEEIKRLPKKFDIIPHILQFKKSLDEINLAIIKDNINELIVSAENIERLIAPTKGKEGTPMIFTITDEVEGKRTMRIHHIPFHLIDYANTLKKANMPS